MAYIEATTVGELLDTRIRQNANHVFCVWKQERITYRQLGSKVNRIANGFIAHGIRARDRVGVMLPHHPDHIFVLLALARIGAVAVPINANLRGDSLEYQLSHSEPHAIVADAEFRDQILPALAVTASPALLFWRGESSPERAGEAPAVPFDRLADAADAILEHRASPEDIVAICYTSGTTGAPKGVLITDAMYRAAATASLLISDIQDGDVPLFWEPMYHMFGIEVVVLALLKPVTLAMVERFSASNFWRWARECGATHIHYVGGVLQLLMKQPPSAEDRDHKVRVAWGGGCPPEVWHDFEQRFGLDMRDSFGMTETAALNIVNTEDIPGALGRVLPYFDARVVDENGDPAPTGSIGQLLIRGREPHIITPGYFRNPEATAETIRDGWLYTGDLVRQDQDGVFWFFSRQKDSVRRRGENVSAWEVERVVNKHPDVEESALITVRNEFGDEDLKIFIKPVGRPFEPGPLIAWCAERMAKFQVPRFVAFINEFPKTPTQRIRKHELSRSVDDCWDREKSAAAK